MDTATIEIFRNRLQRRWDEVLMTISYIERESQSFEKNTEWRDRVTKKRRRGLLDYLSDSYANEKAAIETALDRMLANRYGICVTCNRPIGSEWLEAFPTTESCFSCCRQHRRYPGEVIARPKQRQSFSYVNGRRSPDQKAEGSE